MKHLILLLVTSVISTGMALAQANPLKLGFQDTDNTPYQLGEGSTINWEKPGIAVELIKAVVTKLNLNAEFRRLPWKRGLEALKEAF